MADEWRLVDYYLSPIKHLFGMKGVTDIEINRFDKVFVERNGQTVFMPETRFSSEEDVSILIHQIGNVLGQPVDPVNYPILDARLENGTRVCGVLAPVSTQGSSITFRIFPEKRITAADLLSYGSLSKEILDFLKIAVICRANILISGGTGSGKTTLLNVLSEFIPNVDRVVSVEDTNELKINATNYIALEAPNRRRKEGQVIDLAFLIRTTLRKNPDRIVVGEIRDGHAATAFLHAINTGHTAATSIHANGTRDALSRIQTLVAGHGNLPFDVVRAQVRLNLNILIHAERTPQHGRKVVAIDEIQEGRCVPLWRWDYVQAAHVRNTESKSRIFERLKKYNVNL